MSTSRKHIVLVSSEFPPQPGGIGNHAYHLALHLSQQDYDVKVIADQRSANGKEEHTFDCKQPFEIVRIKRYNMRFFMYLQRIKKTYASLKHAHHVIATGKFSLWNVALLSQLRKVKTLAVIHGTEVNFKPVLLRKSIDLSLKKMDKIVAVSNYTKSLISYLNLNVVVIPNGINASEWQNDNQTNVKLKGNPVLTTVGRVSSRKGQLNVIKQLPELIKQFPEIHYHCIGIPSEAEAFKTVAKQLNVESYVTFHGKLELELLKQKVSATDIFVMMSSESKSGDVEGFGIAILEANALGIPAIGAKGCGIEDAVNDRASGVIIPLDDSEQFIKAIALILKDKNRFQYEARAWAEQHDWSNIITKYTALLD
ncbi:MAG: glycosyltransferase family 4 protein [Algicola sp.]|nr:glycosyltransferase family 4 protein [Algicola sp.]